MSTLYLVGTPIGNLEDITLRAIRILGEASLIAAEDTRVTGRLLARYNIETPMISYHEHSDQERIDRLLTSLSAGDVALVSEAGMPGLSDPGFRLVRAAIDAGVTVTPIPGPTAVVTALVSSGLPTDDFVFLGFLPRRKNARRQKLATVAEFPATLVFYEAPHRLLALLQDLIDVLGDRQLCLGRELTKLHEELWRGRTSQALDHFSQLKVRGELTVVVAGASKERERWTQSEVAAALAVERSRGLSSKMAAASLAGRSGWSKREIYTLAIESKEDET